MGADILLVHPGMSTFIARDVELLRERFQVRVMHYASHRDLPTLVSCLSRSRGALAWFALGYAYPMVRLGRLLRKPTVLVAGGYDVEACPELEYGAMLLPRRRIRTSYALANATRVLAVSCFTQNKVRSWAEKSRVEVLYHGFPVQDPGHLARANQVVTVADVAKHTWRLKGLDTLVEVAKACPDISFVVVGHVYTSPSVLASPLPSNLHFPGRIEPNGLFNVLRGSKVYAQLSYVESFGCALAEAMSVGCFPVATRRGALPEVVGDAGALVEYGDTAATIRAIRNGISQGFSDRGVDRIRGCFSLEARRTRLHQVMEELLDGQS